MTDFEQRLLDTLERIAVALELLAAPPQAAEPVVCEHPIEARIDLGMTDGQPDWQCGVCQFRSIEV